MSEYKPLPKKMKELEIAGYDAPALVYPVQLVALRDIAAAISELKNFPPEADTPTSVLGILANHAFALVEQIAEQVKVEEIRESPAVQGGGTP